MSAPSPETNLREALAAIVAIGDVEPRTIHDQQTQRYSQKAIDIARKALAGTPSPETQTRPVNPADPYFRMVMFFDQDNTAGSFLAEDGEGGFVGAVSRMAREIDRLRSERGYIVGCNDGFVTAIDQAVAICDEKAEEWAGLCGTDGCVDCAKQFAAEIRALAATKEGSAE